MKRETFAYEELKERVPEPEEEMTGKEAMNYFKDKVKPTTSISWYSFVVNDIYSRTTFRNGSVLDVGCGSGGLLRAFESENPKLKLTGVDASKTLLDAAKKMSKLNLKYSRAENLQLESNSFDLVVCQDTVHHFKKPVEVLKEIYRVTKKGGYIYLTDLRRDADKKIIELSTTNIVKSSISHTIFYLWSLKASYTAQEIKLILKKAGIKNYKIIDGQYNSATKKLLDSIKDFEKRKDKDRLFKERWVVIIKK
jgi:ubiquinone/menaquinone biosynthesis C-methylase UbiE